MSAHTPGPWQTSGVRIKMDGEPFLQVDAPNGPGIVAYIPYSDRRLVDHYQSHADQRLIAAAPDLLAAANGLLNTFGKPRRVEFLNDDFEAAMLVYESARAAIAKATGIGE